MAGGLLVAPLAAEAQQATKIARIGYLAASLADPHLPEAFRQGLRDLGYVEGRNVVIEYRDAEGKRAAALAVEAKGRLQMSPGSDPVHVHTSDYRCCPTSGRASSPSEWFALADGLAPSRMGTSESTKGHPEHERRVNLPVDLFTETASTG